MYSRKIVTNLYSEEKPLRREIWDFTLFDSGIRLTEYREEIKPKHKRKFIIQKYWDRLDGRRNTIDKPILSEDVVKQAKYLFCKQIQDMEVI